MSSWRLRRRVPSARPLGAARLEHHVLRMHKRGRDGSAKANVIPANRGEFVWGVVYEIAAAEKPRLDAAEHLGIGYLEQLARVIATDDRTHEARMYVAAPSHIDDELRAFTWYRNYLIAGAREHRLPPEYIAALESIPASPDPDPAREAANRIPG